METASKNLLPASTEGAIDDQYLVEEKDCTLPDCRLATAEAEATRAVGRPLLDCIMYMCLQERFQPADLLSMIV